MLSNNENKKLTGARFSLLEDLKIHFVAFGPKNQPFLEEEVYAGCRAKYRNGGYRHAKSAEVREIDTSHPQYR